ncbi:MAG: helix-turn-helix domain-containing protein [Clostridia bacterium]|nr:helix-turn-helix domain-containing protein [Clostridia bacterium]
MSFLINKTEYASVDRYPMHKHEDYEIITYTSGLGTLCVEGEVYNIKAGDVAIIPSNSFHGTKCIDSLKSLYVHGNFSPILNLSHAVILSDNEKREGGKLLELIYENRFKNEEYLKALCDAYMYFLIQNLKTEDNVGRVVNGIIKNIEENFSNTALSPNSLLSDCGYAEDYIRAQFKRLTGKTPSQFLCDVRIKHARHLIDIHKYSLSLSEIANLCGYADYVYFSKKFHSITGLSPRDYKDNL